MIEPKPVGSVVARPKPIKILSKDNLRAAWDVSRDSKAHAGTAGIDNESAKQFASNLDENLDKIRKRLLTGAYRFSRLRPVFIQKANSRKERVICIPTVRDRIVQRAIVQYLERSRKLPIYNSSSFGFIKGLGTKNAIEKAVELRSLYEWSVKADIESFFDQVPRSFVRERISAVLQNHSLVPLICDAITCEIRGPSEVQARAAAQGIRGGLGIRQGMPLSPILANLVLSKFDRAMEMNQIPMVRYADDLLLFFGTREEAKQGQELVEQHLARVGLKLSQAKTTVHGPNENISFLGLEIAFLEKLDKYVARVSRVQIRKIRDRLESDYSYATRFKFPTTLNETIVGLSRSVAAYLGVYQNAHNYPVLLRELEGCMKLILANLYSDIFGVDVFEKLDEPAKRFLGIDMISTPVPSGDLEW
jgi:group II intron reverse transcriptase/maturase